MEVKSIWAKLTEPSRIVASIVAASCLFVSTGVGAFFLGSHTGSLVLDLVIKGSNSLPFMKLFTSGLSLSILTACVEFIGWGAFVYCFRETCIKLLPSDDRKKFWLCATIMSSCVFIYTVARVLKNVLSVPLLGVGGTSTAKMFVFLAAVGYAMYMAFINSRFSIKHWATFIVLPINLYFLVYFMFLHNNHSVLPSDYVVQLYGNVWLDYIPSSNTLVWLWECAWRRALQVVSFLIPQICFKYWTTFLFVVLTETFALSAVVGFPYQVINANIDKGNSKRWLLFMLIIVQFVTILSGLIFEGGVNVPTEYHYAVSNGIKTASRELKSLALFENTDFLRKVGIFATGIASAVMIASNYVLFWNYKSPESSNKKTEKKKSSIGFAGAIRLCKQHPVLASFAAITVCYSLGASFLEQTWQAANKATANEIAHYFFPGDSALKMINENIYQAIYSAYIINQGRIALMFLTVLTPFLSRKLSWFTFSSIAPMGLFALSLCFFIPLVIAGGVGGTLFGVPALLIASTVGSMCLLFIKSFKIAGVDYTKEYALSVRTLEEKTMAKNIEVAVGRTGKFGSSFSIWVICALTHAAGKDFTSSPIAMIFICVVIALACIAWQTSIFVINKDLKEQIGEKKDNEN